MWRWRLNLTTVRLASVLVLQGLACGCGEMQPKAPGQQAEPAGAAAEAEAPRSPQELLATIQETAGVILTSNPTKSDDEQRKRIETAVRAAERLAAHPQADAEARRTARTARLLLLHFGARTAPETFEQPFGDFVTQLLKEDPRSNDAALGAAGWLEVHHLGKARRGQDLLPLLIDYSQAYPDCPAGVELFERYGRLLEGWRSRSAAIECYRAALAAYGQNPQSQVLAQRLEALERSETQAGEPGAALERVYAKVRGRLGGQTDGYFVVYAEEQVTARQGLIVWYHYEYEVLHGLQAAVDYDLRLPEKWTWEVVRRFSDTPEGRQTAFDLRNELIRKKRKGTSPKSTSNKPKKG